VRWLGLQRWRTYTVLRTLGGPSNPTTAISLILVLLRRFGQLFSRGVQLIQVAFCHSVSVCALWAVWFLRVSISRLCPSHFVGGGRGWGLGLRNCVQERWRLEVFASRTLIPPLVRRRAPSRGQLLSSRRRSSGLELGDARGDRGYRFVGFELVTGWRESKGVSLSSAHGWISRLEGRAGGSIGRGGCGRAWAGWWVQRRPERRWRGW